MNWTRHEYFYIFGNYSHFHISIVICTSEIHANLPDRIMPLIDVAEIGQIQKLLTKSHDELSHSLKLLDRIGSVCHNSHSSIHIPRDSTITRTYITR